MLLEPRRKSKKLPVIEIDFIAVSFQNELIFDMIILYPCKNLPFETHPETLSGMGIAMKCPLGADIS